MHIEADAREMNPAEPHPPPAPRAMEHPVAEMEIADDALVILVGPSGCGKSTFALARFPANEIVSSDECRRMVSDDEASQAASRAAFAVFDAIVYGRLAHGRRTVADATNLSPWSRERLREMAAEHGRPVVAIAFDAPLGLCVAQQQTRERRVAADVVELHHAHMQQALAELPGEGYTHLYIVRPGG
jgi:protein phosphatase